MTFVQPPNENRNSTNFEDFRVSTHYCEEADVFEATGLSSEFCQNLGSVDASAVTALINGYIAKADERIRRLLGVPITVRKEEHVFENNPVIQLGPDREDPFEFFGAFEPNDKVLDVYAIYYNGQRTKTPYPKNWDQITDTISGWGYTDAILALDTDDKKCGDGSLHATVASPSGGTIFYPSTKNFNRRIYPWFYVGFWFKSAYANKTFQFRIVRDTESYYYMNFTVTLANTWVPIMLNIRRFAFSNVGGEGAQPDFNWILTYTQYFAIVSDDEGEFWIDNFSFNDGFFATYPEGSIVWSMPDWYPTGTIQVTYAYDPFLGSIPPALEEASAKLAGVLLLDWCIGKRQMVIAFEEMADTLAESPDKVTLEGTRRRLENEAYVALESLGYRTFEGLG